EPVGVVLDDFSLVPFVPGPANEINLPVHGYGLHFVQSARQRRRHGPSSRLLLREHGRRSECAKHHPNKDDAAKDFCPGHESSPLHRMPISVKQSAAQGSFFAQSPSTAFETRRMPQYSLYRPPSAWRPRPSSTERALHRAHPVGCPAIDG